MRGNQTFLSVLLIVSSARAAMAADLTLARTPSAASEKIEYGNVYFGTDWNTHKSLVGYVGVLYAPSGMDTSGVRLAAFGLIGKYGYHVDDGTSFNGRFGSADALVGWSHVFDQGAVTLSIGANYQNHRISPVDPSNSVQGAKTGFKVQGDLWVNPTPRTLVYALGSYSTAFNTYYSIGRLGYDVMGSGWFVGPEVGGLGNERTDQFRVGVHLTGLNVGVAKLGISGGWLRERNEGGGWYTAANMDFSF